MSLLIEKVKNIIRREEKMNNSTQGHNPIISKSIASRAKLDIKNRDKEIADLIINNPSIKVTDIAEHVSIDVRTVYNSINRQGLKGKRTHKEGNMITCISCGKKVLKSVARIINEKYYCSIRCAKTVDTNDVTAQPKERNHHINNPVKPMVSIQCDYCKTYVDRDQYQYNAAIKHGQKMFFCCRQHYGNYRRENPAETPLKTKSKVTKTSNNTEYPADTTDFNRLFSSLAVSGTEFNIVTPWAGRSSVDVSFICNVTLEELNMSNVSMLRDVILGPPQVTDYSMIEDLQNLGIYGLYEPVVIER